MKVYDVDQNKTSNRSENSVVSNGKNHKAYSEIMIYLYQYNVVLVMYIQSYGILDWSTVSLSLRGGCGDYRL